MYFLYRLDLRHRVKYSIIFDFILFILSANLAKLPTPLTNIKTNMMNMYTNESLSLSVDLLLEVLLELLEFLPVHLNDLDLLRRLYLKFLTVVPSRLAISDSFETR